MATNLLEQINEIQKRITSQEQCLGKGLQQPFNCTNSGSRKIMFGTHSEHLLGLIHAERPIIGTGYESEFGHNSSSFMKVDDDYVVVDVIPKYRNKPKYHYYLIVLNNRTNELDVIERVSYKHITESYGYQYNNDYLDGLSVGSIIYKGDVVKKSTSFDEYNNRMDGINLTTAYMASDYSMEDGIILSESAALKLAAPLYKKLSIIINDNDILLNLYGDNDTYKVMPDVGEHIKDGIVCATRREKNEEALFTQSFNRLKDIMMPDDKFTTKGQVVDINIFCNNPDGLRESYYNMQLNRYYEEHVAFCKSVIRSVEEVKIGGIKVSYNLQKLLFNCQSVVDGKKYIKDGKDKKVFSNIILEIIVMEIKPLNAGDKLSDRYGGKGVVSKINPDHLMPRLENGELVEMINNSSTCVNRENPGQEIETSINNVGKCIIDYISSGLLEVEDSFNLIYDFINILNPEQAEFFEKYARANCNSDVELAMFLDTFCNDGGIQLSLKPVSDSVNLLKLDELYKKFPFAQMSEIKVPMIGSNNDIRYIPAHRRILCSKKYVYRLKQYAEEKFSATSLSSTNIRNENSRSKANKMYKGIYTKTPIRFGEMEQGDMIHLGVEPTIINLMLHSASPSGRRLAEQLLTSDPFNIDVRLDDTSKNRGVEILSAYLKTMGLKLEFFKQAKNRAKPILKKPITYFGNRDELISPIAWHREGEKPFNVELSGKVRPIARRPIVYYGKK